MWTRRINHQLHTNKKALGTVSSQEQPHLLSGQTFQESYGKGLI
ncbi:NEDD9 isoform 6 [Pan troglodytes]|uniref:NEDD9 isoform 6 n=1 Tax=Pan troglodytes TaxID=9598 RepID=A0A2J8MTK1_PANTR|nr:NEDD9 isoform 6 [Pan troglodytes]